MRCAGPVSRSVVQRVRRAMKELGLGVDAHAHNVKPLRVLVAVSGGRDSVCALHVMKTLLATMNACREKAKQAPFDRSGDATLSQGPEAGLHELAAIHCDHRWPGDEGIAEHVQRVTDALGIHLHVITQTDGAAENGIKSSERTETGARDWRYACIRDICATFGYTTVITGHTKSDRVETMLLNLVTGCGMTGIASIPRRRPLSSTQHTSGEFGQAEPVDLVRPLLDIWRAETAAYCVENELAFHEDAYNTGTTTPRNRIRNELIPYLRTHFNPQVEQHLAHTSELMASERDFLSSHTRDVFQRVLLPSSSTADPGDHAIKLDARILAGQSIATQRRVLRMALLVRRHAPRKRSSSSGSSFAKVEAVRYLLDHPRVKNDARGRQCSFQFTPPGRAWMSHDGTVLHIIPS